jgi:hypothetical protein
VVTAAGEVVVMVMGICLLLGKNISTNFTGGWVGPQHWSGLFREKKNLLFQLGFKTQIVQSTA